MNFLRGVKKVVTLNFFTSWKIRDRNWDGNTDLHLHSCMWQWQKEPWQVKTPQDSGWNHRSHRHPYPASLTSQHHTEHSEAWSRDHLAEAQNWQCPAGGISGHSPVPPFLETSVFWETSVLITPELQIRPAYKPEKSAIRQNLRGWEKRGKKGCWWRWKRSSYRMGSTGDFKGQEALKKALLAKQAVLSLKPVNERQRMGSYCLVGTCFPVGKMKKALAWDGADVCTTAWLLHATERHANKWLKCSVLYYVCLTQ